MGWDLCLGTRLREGRCGGEEPGSQPRDPAAVGVASGCRAVHGILHSSTFWEAGGSPGCGEGERQRQIQGSAAAIYLRQPRDETDDRGREAAGAGTETKAPSTA